MNDMDVVYKAGHKAKGIRLSATGALHLWRQHCEFVHDATAADYRLDVVLWHRTAHPRCKWDIGSWHWNDDAQYWTGSGR